MRCFWLCLQAIEAMEVSSLEAQHSGAAAAVAVAGNAAADEVPSDLLCPITYQLLEDPVILVDSHQTYGEQRRVMHTMLNTNTRPYFGPNPAWGSGLSSVPDMYSLALG